VLGWFSPSAVFLGWFEETAQPAGWFEKSWLDVSGATATGELPSLTLVAPTGRAEGEINADRFGGAAWHDEDWRQPVRSATARGAVPALVLVAPTGTATASARASAALPALRLLVNPARASGHTRASATLPAFNAAGRVARGALPGLALRPVKQVQARGTDGFAAARREDEWLIAA
jgi:hypothetical protein